MRRNTRLKNKTEIVEELKSKNNTSVSMIQKKYKVGFKLAVEVYKELTEKQ